MLRHFSSILIVVLVVSMTLCGGFSAFVPQVAAAETVTIARTPAFYKALADIYTELVSIHNLLTELIAREAAEKDKNGVTPVGAVRGVTVKVNYATKISQVTISYRDGATHELTTSSVESKAIEAVLASELKMSTKELAALTTYTYINGDKLVKILVTLKNSRHITIAKMFADGSSQSEMVPTEEIDTMVKEDFFGKQTVYQAFFNDYVAQIKKGQTPSDAIAFVAEIINVPLNAATPIIEFAF